MNPLMRGVPTVGAIDQQVMQQMQQMASAIGAMQNPEAALMQMAQQNPQLAGILEMCKGRSPKEVFFEQCRQHGTNPDDIIPQLNRAGFNLK